MAIRLFEMNFYGRPAQLYSTKLVDSSGRGFVSIRGKGNGALQGAGSFQWSTAVKALTLLMVRAAQVCSKGESLGSVVLIGGQGSLAKSLDYALTKQPGWILDMFGVDSTGNSNLKRVLRRSNSEQKMPGPVIVGLNIHGIEETALRVCHEGQQLSSQVDLDALLSELEQVVL